MKNNELLKDIDKGIWIPRWMMENNNFSWTKKAIYMEISQLEELENGCTASNRHFAEKIGISNAGVSKAINEMRDSGYITIDNAQTKRNFGRVLAINYRKSAINSRKSPINLSIETKEKKLENKLFNKPIPPNPQGNKPTSKEENAQIKQNQDSTNALGTSKDKQNQAQVLYDAWNAKAETSWIRGLRKLNQTRIKKISIRIKQDSNFKSDFLEVLNLIDGFNDFNKKSWFSFDWLIANENNILKVLEGKYTAKDQDGDQNHTKASKNAQNVLLGYLKNTIKPKLPLSCHDKIKVSIDEVNSILELREKNETWYKEVFSSYIDHTIINQKFSQQFLAYVKSFTGKFEEVA